MCNCRAIFKYGTAPGTRHGQSPLFSPSDCCCALWLWLVRLMAAVLLHRDQPYLAGALVWQLRPLHIVEVA